MDSGNDKVILKCFGYMGLAWKKSLTGILEDEGYIPCSKLYTIGKSINDLITEIYHIRVSVHAHDLNSKDIVIGLCFKPITGMFHRCFTVL